ncbi:MAG: hypothetical protein LUQ11_02615 [Methylococcaceae bacterium]|nr:hypothetical protein [Methylococcaceae bacterium]
MAEVAGYHIPKFMVVPPVIKPMPSAMFKSVFDGLRNERTINIYFAQDRGFFVTSTKEPVGEAQLLD